VRRFRLRFAFQEIDLPAGTFLIGRAKHCHLTIDDPLVSREHARIRVTPSGASIDDMNSRNGVFVNGKAVHEEVPLADGDRIRVGPQELVFGASVLPDEGTTRTTGAMVYCGACGVPYALELPRCPACGSRERQDEVPGSTPSSRDWGLELGAEALGKAVQRASWADAERVLESVRAEIESRLRQGKVIERGILAAVAEGATDVSLARGDAAWAKWILSVYARLAELPASHMSRTLTTLPPAQRSTLIPAARRVMESLETNGGPRPEDLEAYRGFEEFLAQLTGS
jgi:hypothetical protein